MSKPSKLKTVSRGQSHWLLRSPHVTRCLPLEAGVQNLQTFRNMNMHLLMRPEIHADFLKIWHIYYKFMFNLLSTSDANMRQWNESWLVKVMACCPCDAKPFPESIMTYCRLDPHQDLHSWKFTGTCDLQHRWPFLSRPQCVKKGFVSI